jgi:hypothetical protein
VGGGEGERGESGSGVVREEGRIGTWNSAGCLSLSNSVPLATSVTMLPFWAGVTLHSMIVSIVHSV